MATGLVKWCRARFLAGYKPFSVVGGGPEGSDAEELLAGVTAPCSSSPPPPPPPPPPTSLLTPPESPTTTIPQTATAVNENQTNSHATRQLSFEEFECDVSVAEGDRRRQEFSFTLYDFDGHGKITKDDIAGLVTTIYDTLGASIQVPPCGSKTIKVKLTVSPDQRSGQAQILTPPPIKASNLPQSLPAPTPCCHVKHVTSCGHAKHHSRRVPRRRRVQRHRCQSEHGVDSPTEDDARNVTTASHQSKQEELRRRVGPVPHLPSPYSNSSEGDVSEDSDGSPLLTPLTPLIPNQRKRSGAMQRQQLLEIIQANMEKNNLSFHASRKRHQNEHARIPLRSPYTEPSSPYIQRCRQSQTPRHPSYHKPVRENSSHHHHHPNSLPDVPITIKHRINGRKQQQQQQQRSHNSPHQQTATNVANSTPPPPQPHTALATADNYNPQINNTISQNLTTSSTQNNLNTNNHNNHNHNNSCSNNQNNHNNTSNNQNNQNNLHTNLNQRNENHIQQQQKQQEQQQQQPQSTKHPGKKHQLKHATREQDQARAMAQVVRWLEREFSQGAAAAAAAAGRRHVHEHIHHHYHHYHAEALV